MVVSCFLCGNSINADLCRGCGHVGVCHAHESLHKTDGGQCSPVFVGHKSEVGHCLIAARDIHPGELLLTDTAVAFGPKDISPSTLCVECLHVGPTEKCSGCHFPLCPQDSPHSQVHSWEECKLLARMNMKADIAYECLTPLRLLLALRNDRDLCARVDLLMDHRADSRDPEADIRVAETLAYMMGEPGEIAEPLRAIGLLKTNALDAAKGKGRALYPLFSFASHSCLNNSKHVTENDIGGRHIIRLYSQTAISKGDEVTITYTNLLRPTCERRERLEYLWHFMCQCRRCQDPTELNIRIGDVRCPLCLEPMDTMKMTVHCSKCNTTFDRTTVDHMVNSFHSFLDDITVNARQINPADLETFLTTTERVLHPNHYLRIIAARYLTQLYHKESDKKLLERKVYLCQMLLSIFNILDPGLSQSRGLTLFEMATAKLALDGEAHNEVICQLVFETVQCLDCEISSSIGGRAKEVAKSLMITLKK